MERQANPQPQRIVLSPDDTFHLGPGAGLQMSQEGKIGFSGEGLKWHQMRFAIDGIDVPLLGGEDGRPYYEAHWAQVIALEAGKSPGRRAVLKLAMQGCGDWLGPPDTQGRRQPLVFSLLANAFRAQISTKDLVDALASSDRYRSSVDRGNNLLELALKMRLFGVAESLWQQGHRFSEGTLTDGTMITALSMPNVVGEGACLSNIIERLAGHRPIKRRQDDEARFEQKEQAWLEAGWQAFVETTKHWLQRLDECQTSWTGRHRLRSESNGHIQDIELPWAGTIFMFPMRDYAGRQGQSTIPLYASWQDHWRQTWRNYLDRLPDAMPGEPRCKLGDRRLSLVQLLREQGQGELASHLERRALEALAAPAATQHKMARL